MRLNLYLGISAMSIPFALLAGSFIYQYGGSLALWSTSLGLMSLALLYVVFFVKESVAIDDIAILKECPKGNGYCKHQSHFIQRLFGSFAITFKSCPGYKRASILLLLSTAFLDHFIKGISQMKHF